MFGLGDLFYEDDSSHSTNSTDCHCKQNNINVYGGQPLPASSKLSSGLCGIYNQGATCYMNSLLQTLVMTPEFRESLFGLDVKEIGTLTKENNHKKVRVIPLKLQHLFARLLLLNAQAASTGELTNSFGWNKNEELIQHDVQELNRILFSAIEESLVGTSGQDMIRNLYHGAIVNKIICDQCGKTSERQEDFLDLCVTVSGSNSLEQSLSRYYIQTETLSGNNQYRCGSCNRLVNAKKAAKIRHLPPLLTVSLLRFRFDFQKQERYKETNRFAFPLQLDMSPYVEDVSTADDTVYELFSVVNHSGGAYGGHYTAYIRDIDRLGHWTHPNDEDIQVAPDPKSGKVDLIECDSPLELIQVILNKSPDKGMPVDTLCMEINKQTGVSWNKRFKGRYGPINKFLKKHTDRFLTSTNNYVCLHTATLSNGVGRASTNNSCGDTKPGTKEVITTKRTRMRSPPPEAGYCWFHFNDSRVRPVRTKELEKLYSGKSSAYMLFYRRTCLQRPPEARNSPEYMVPKHLIQLIQEENQDLDKERLMYEVKMNMILIKLLFPQLLTLKDGALQTKDNALSYVELAVDKRKSVSDLLQQIEETYGELLFGGFMVHFAKLLPAGIHVYYCVSDQQDKVIADMEIVDNGFLLVWDGKQINGDKIYMGASNEPILVAIICPEHKQLNHAFRKSLTVGQLKHEMCSLMGQDPHKTVISHVAATGDDMDVSQLLPEHQDKTLDELNITNGDRFLLEDSSDKTKPSQPSKGKIKEDSSLSCFMIENRCGKMINGEWPTLCLKIQPDSTVGELKTKVLSEIHSKGLEDCVCRLRPEDDNLGLLPPVPECARLCESGIKANNKMVLERGVAPQTDQLCLTFTPDKPDANQQNVEVMISGHKTIGDLLYVIIEQAGKQGTDWHLRRTNWCGEAADLLDDLGLTLVECQLKSGDHLLLEEGLLPPKGYIKLNIELYPAAVAKSNYVDVLSSLTKGVNGLVSPHKDSTAGKAPVNLGEIVIPLSDTVEDLKLMILTLSEGDNLLVPTIDFLRVRLVDEGQLTTVLKDHKQTLQRLKLSNDITLGVQVLKDEENMSNNDILLEIKLHIPGTQAYLPSSELIWNTTNGTTPDSLRHAIASHLSLPADRLIMAKYYPSKYDWIILEDESQHKNNHQRDKKKGHKKVNLKQAPYYIKDGSIIGVKDLDYEKENLDDFSTQNDIDGKERHRLEAEQRKKRREQLRAAATTLNSGFGKGHKEMAIKIHVDNFR